MTVRIRAVAFSRMVLAQQSGSELNLGHFRRGGFDRGIIDRIGGDGVVQDALRGDHVPGDGPELFAMSRQDGLAR
jgi:hypothetical protein